MLKQNPSVPSHIKRKWKLKLQIALAVFMLGTKAGQK